MHDSNPGRPRRIAKSDSIRRRAARPSRAGVACALALLSAAPGGPARATGEARLPDDAGAARADPIERPFKFTAARYDYGGFGPGTDLNLRYRGDTATAWIGAYRDRAFGEQWRAGLESAFEPFPGLGLSIQPSLQVASRGFVGGSVTAELGAPWFVLAGLGRTNLRPYFNLNFDPNDAWTLALGHREENGRTLYAMIVADNRLGSHQRHLHLVARLPAVEGRRLTVDLLRKTGDGDDGPVRAWGWSATWDGARWFVRIARDPRQNFGVPDATRVSVGTRF